MLLSDVSDRTHWHSMVPAGHQIGDVNAASLFEIPHWALPQRGGPRLMTSVLVSQEFIVDYGYL